MSTATFSFEFARVVTALIIIVGAAFFLFRFDDLVFDLGFWAGWIKRKLFLRNFEPLTVEVLRDRVEQRIAVYVPCWHESDVIARMLDFAARSIEYATYDIFVGAYPNDPETLEKIRAMEKIHPNVHLVVNDRNGPTTKAQNLNCIYREMQRLEGDDPFRIIVLHDVEDIIHPLSFLLYNYLIPTKEMVQLPVFPLERPWTKWTAWTYADEFAENHMKDLIFREAIGSFVPAAGVGCAFSRDALDIVSATQSDLFPESALTEDYQFALRLHVRGLKTIFVNQRLSSTGGRRPSTAAAYVATRAYFPDTAPNAIRQKSRWVAGIGFQAWKMMGWSGDFVTRYGLYRDRKGIVANVAVLLGYIVLTVTVGLFIWHHFNPLIRTPNIGSNPVIWGILDFVLVMTLVELLQTALIVAWLYGPLQGCLSLLRPPWSAFINGCATLSAAYAFTVAQMFHTDMQWSKTAHAFPTEVTLAEFRRQIGQILLSNDKISQEQLRLGLEEQKHSRGRLGETLVRLGFVKKREVAEAIAAETGTPTAWDDELTPDPDVLALLPESLARSIVALPLHIENGALIIAMSNLPRPDQARALQRHLKRPYTIWIADESRLEYAIDRSYRFNDERRKPIGRWLVDRGLLSQKRLQSALRIQGETNKPFLQLLVENGVFRERELLDILQDYFGVQVIAVRPGSQIIDERMQHFARETLLKNEIAIIEREGKAMVISAFPLSDRLAQQFQDEFNGDLGIAIARQSDVVRERTTLLKVLGEDPILAGAVG
ncbi:MAG: phage adsorption protein NrfB [Candidatus Eremiobacteraeota bacterium]|nr:phage adsorption protein NrfB [Candidatus Eremiobacteraeota bacterium]